MDAAFACPIERGWHRAVTKPWEAEVGARTALRSSLSAGRQHEDGQYNVAAALTSSRPYLIRAIYDWILDNDCTPYLLVNATVFGAQVPTQYVKEGKIVLNIGPSAVKSLELGNEWIEFEARFGGAAMRVRVPVQAAMAVYARENGQGMVFPEEETAEPPEPPEPSPPSGKPTLKVVK